MPLQKLYLNSSGVWTVFYGGAEDVVAPPVSTRASLTGLQGTYKPSLDTVGVPDPAGLVEGTAGTFAPPNTTVTISGSTSRTYENMVLRCDFDIRTTGTVIFRNCYLRGWNKPWSSESAWISCLGNLGNRNVIIEDCWINPDYPTPWANGISGCDFTARRNLIENTNDGIGAQRPLSPNSDIRVRIHGNWIRNLAYWTPDTAYNPPTYRAQTHNDCIQIFSGSGVDIVGNLLHANASTTAGSVPYGTGYATTQFGSASPNPWFPSVTGQVITITPTRTGIPVTGINIDRNWLDYGQTSIVVAHQQDTTNTTTATITNNIFGRQQALISGRRVAINLDNVLTVAGFGGAVNSYVPDTVNNNTWEDTGDPVYVQKRAF